MSFALRSTLVASVLVALGISSSCAGKPDERWTDLKREIRERYPSVSQVSTDELARWLADVREDAREPIVLLDARANEEFLVSHLAGAELAGDEDAVAKALEHVPQDRRIVVYCSVGYRSSALAESLARDGFSDVHNLEGSIFEWANEGRPLVRDGAPTHGVHPYDEDWGKLLEREHWEWPRTESPGDAR